MRKLHYLLAAAIGMTLLLSGCGGAESAGSAVSEAAMDSGGALIQETAAAASQPRAVAASEGTGSEQKLLAPEEAASGDAGDELSLERKLIKNVNLDAETTEFDQLLELVNRRVEELGGYIEQMDSHAPSGSDSAGERSAYIDARIPADRLEEFMDTALEGAHITYRSETVTDVTLQYTDLESRQKVLRIEQDRLMELLAEAERSEALIALEQRLSEIRYELESLESQLRVYDNQVSYSTVSISLREVSTLSPDAGSGFLDQLQTGFQKNVRTMLNFLRNAVLFLLTGLPMLLPVAIMVILVYSIHKRRILGRRRSGPEPNKDMEKADRRHADDEAGKTEFHRS